MHSTKVSKNKFKTPLKSYQNKNLNDVNEIKGVNNKNAKSTDDLRKVIFIINLIVKGFC